MSFTQSIHPYGDLSAQLALSYSDWNLEVLVKIEASQTVGLIGPNGAGKSTIVNGLAGLIALDTAQIQMGEKWWHDTSRSVWVPPEQRSVGIMFQDSLLFPYHSVRQNLGYGLRSRGWNRKETTVLVSEWIERLGLEDVAELKPSQISGGMAQRVALGRALITSPQLLLLDEPLSALDMESRPQLRRLLSEHLVNFPGPRMLITHDPIEAMLLSDRILVLEEGRIVQSGSPNEIRSKPLSRYSSTFGALNLWEGEIGSTDMVTIGSHILKVVPVGWKGSVLVSVAPQAVSLHLSQPEGSARNVWKSVISELISIAEEGRVRVRLTSPLDLVVEITQTSREQLRLEPGQEVWVSIKATEISVSPL